MFNNIYKIIKDKFRPKLTGKNSLFLSSIILSFLIIFQGNNDPIHRGTSISTPDTVIAARNFNKGEEFYAQAKYDSSIYYFKLACDIYKKENIYEKYIFCNTKIGNNYIRKSEYNNAMIYLNKALKTGLENLNENNLFIAHVYHGIALIYFYTKEYDKALDNNNKALLIRVNKTGEKDRDVAMSYNNLGLIYQHRGYYDKALEFHNKSLLIKLEIFDENHIDLSLSYINMGLIYFEKGNFWKALEFYQKALSIKLQHLDENHPSIARYYEYIGHIYYFTGDFDKGLEYYRRSLSIRQQYLGKNHVEVAYSYITLGNFYYERKDFNLALDYYQKSLSILIEKFGENNPDVAGIYSNIGLIFIKKNNIKESLKFLNKSLLINNNIFGYNHPVIADVYFYLGNAYKEEQKYNKALNYYNKSLTILNQIFGANHPAVVENYQQIGRIYLEQEKIKSALRYFQKSIISSVQGFKETNIYINPSLENIISEPLLLTSLELKAKSFEKYYSIFSKDIKDINSSLSTYKIALKLLDEMRFGYDTESSKMYMGQEFYEIYEQAIGTAFKLFELTGDEKYKNDIFSFTEKSKSFILRQSLSESKAKYFAGIPDSILAKEKSLKIDLAFYNKSLLEETRKKENRDSIKISLWESTLFNLQRDYEILIDQFEKKYPKYYDLKFQSNTKSVEDVQEKIIDDKTALIEYFTGKNRLFILLITKTNFDIIPVKKDSSFNEYINSLRTGIINRDYVLYTKNAYRMYQILIKPVEEKIKQKKLIIIPDGILGYVPFETLLTEVVDKNKINYQDLAYLIKYHQISYSYSSTLLFENINKKIGANENTFLGMAPGVYH